MAPFHWSIRGVTRQSLLGIDVSEVNMADSALFGPHQGAQKNKGYGPEPYPRQSCLENARAATRERSCEGLSFSCCSIPFYHRRLRTFVLRLEKQHPSSFHREFARDLRLFRQFFALNLHSLRPLPPTQPCLYRVLLPGPHLLLPGLRWGLTLQVLARYSDLLPPEDSYPLLHP